MFSARLWSTRIAAIGLVGCLAHVCERGEVEEYGSRGMGPEVELGVGVPARRPEEDARSDASREDEHSQGSRADHRGADHGPALWRVTRTSWPLLFSRAASLAGSIASCKEAGNAVSTSQVEQTVNEVALLLEEHAHRRGSKTQSCAPSVSFDSNGFRATFSVPRGAVTSESLVDGIRAAVRLLQSMPGSMSLSLSKQDTVGDEGRASCIRVQTAAGVGDLRIDFLQPFDAEKDCTLEVYGDMLSGSVELMRGALAYVCSPGGKSTDWNPWDTMLDGGGQAPMLGAMEEIMRLLMEETRRAGIAMGELDVEHGRHYDRRMVAGRDGLVRRDGASSGDPESTGVLGDTEKLVKTLEERGIRTYLPDKDAVNATQVDWRGLAGYEEQKREIEENLLLPLRHPEIFDAIAAKTRAQYTSNRPRAILFTGPPGTGKTSSARVIASQAGVPLCYIPLEAIASKWYGESEKKLSEALEMIDAGFKEGAVIFLDELDSLATTRGSDMHEATRRMLGVLLRFLDGFDQNKRAVVVGATNTPGDLDPALRSRFSANIEFGLPDEPCRVKILKQYAQHLPEEDLVVLAKATAGFSGRDLRDVCGYAERHWASLIIKGTVHEGSTPGLPGYLEAVRAR